MVKASCLQRTGQTPCPLVGVVQLRAAYRSPAIRGRIVETHAARNEYLAIGQESRRVIKARFIKIACTAQCPRLGVVQLRTLDGDGEFFAYNKDPPVG
jgi:hypothetical protein